LSGLLTRARARAARAGAAIYYEGVRRLRLPAVRRRWGHAPVILCYHNVVADQDGPIGAAGLHLPFSRFARQMRWLADHYEVVSLRDFLARASDRTSRPLAAITFDDAYAGVFQYAAPLLERLGLRATVFVVAEAAERRAGFWWDQPRVVAGISPSLRERWLSDLRGDGDAILSAVDVAPAALPPAYCPADWATIRAHAGRPLEIGVHSATHRFLPALTDAELDHEVTASRAAIHRQTGSRAEFFAYPYGACDARVRAAVRRAGYRAAFGLDANGGATDPWTLRRVNVPSGISPSAFEAWTAGIGKFKVQSTEFKVSGKSLLNLL
jgi:peptidoglycan/xylan/chitin deacetylase (PgdA/CDA1 family)